MVKALIFDLDNTLYDYDSANKIAREALAKTAGELLKVTPDEFLRVYDQANQEVKARMGNSASCHNRMLFSQRAVEILGGNLVNTTPRLYDAYWNKVLEVMELYPGVKRLLDSLKANGIKIGICTDMTAHIQYRKLAVLGLADYIDAIVTSEEMGVEKPHAAMFHAVLDKLKTASHETVYIGDSYERDIIGAQNVGITPVWYVAGRKHEEKPDILTIKDYDAAKLWDKLALR